MNEETRKKYELLKEKNKAKVIEKYISENEFFQECLDSLGAYTILDKGRTAGVWNRMTTELPFIYAGHIQWDEVTCKNIIFSPDDIRKYSDLEKDCFILWSNALLPGVMCKLKSIVDNLDDVNAVDFYTWIVSEDFSYIIELTSSGNPHIAMLG